MGHIDLHADEVLLAMIRQMEEEDLDTAEYLVKEESQIAMNISDREP